MKLEGLVFIGGGYAVLVLPGGSAKMSSCAVIGPFFGLGVGDFAITSSSDSGIEVSKLEAQDVKVSGCGRRGLTVGRGGQANVRKCEFMDGLHCGIFVSGDSTSKLVAADVRCGGNKKRAVSVISSGTALLSRCDLTGNAGGCLFVQDPQSMVKYGQCTLDSEAVVVNHATLQEVRCL